MGDGVDQPYPFARKPVWPRIASRVGLTAVAILFWRWAGDDTGGDKSFGLWLFAVIAGALCVSWVGGTALRASARAVATWRRAAIVDWVALGAPAAAVVTDWTARRLGAGDGSSVLRLLTLFLLVVGTAWAGVGWHRWIGGSEADDPRDADAEPADSVGRPAGWFVLTVGVPVALVTPPILVFGLLAALGPVADVLSTAVRVVGDGGVAA
ncbi:MAG: hypothetical protein ACRD0G_09410, partial [Acidimicrobiales bacterium]